MSNDRIFDVKLVTHAFHRKNKLKKNAILRIIKQWKEDHLEHEDMEHFPNYIVNIPELEVNQNDVVYFRE